ncbi:MAG: BPL-N domain-containing protein [Solirubrobacteraceae bacterium]
MKQPERRGRIALYGGGGSPFHHAAVFVRGGHDVEFVFPADVRAGALEGFDAFVMPGGGYRAMMGQIEPLGVEGARALRAYVDGGGMYIGCCAGSYDAATVAPSFLELCPAQAEMCLLDARVWNEGGEEWGLRSPGIGVLRAETVAPGHPVMGGMPETFEIAHYNGPLFVGAQPLARVAGRTDRFTAWEEMLGPSPERALIDDAAQAGIANVVAGGHGQGRVVLFGSHPEFGFSIAMEDEQPPARMLLNAIDWQLSESGAPERPPVDLVTHVEPREEDTDPGCVGELADQLADRTAAIRARGDHVRWLEQAYAMSFFGLAPREIWSRSLDAIDRLAAQAAQHAGEIDPRVLGFRPPIEWELDGGYHGVVALLEQSLDMLDQALSAWRYDPGEPTANPYADMTTSPYHLVAGSYLAAVGRVGAAALLAATFSRVVTR